ncbi:MAG: hypothetical protein QM756_05385 [Polyangiaceae bacterium]
MKWSLLWPFLVSCASAPTPATRATADPAVTGCELETRLERLPVVDGVHRLRAALLNRTPRALAFRVVGQCPGSPARVFGLPVNYDYYRVCNAGACVGGPRSERGVDLPAGQGVELGTFEINPRGDECNHAPTPGRYLLSFDVTVEGARVCRGEMLELVLEAPAPVVQTPTPARYECPAIACAPACFGPSAHDEHGCPTCNCQQSIPRVVPVVPVPGP